MNDKIKTIKELIEDRISYLNNIINFSITTTGAIDNISQWDLGRIHQITSERMFLDEIKQRGEKNDSK